MKDVTVLDFSEKQQILKAKNGKFDKKSSSWIFSEEVLYQLIQATNYKYSI